MDQALNEDSLDSTNDRQIYIATEKTIYDGSKPIYYKLLYEELTASIQKMYASFNSFAAKEVNSAIRFLSLKES